MPQRLGLDYATEVSTFSECVHPTYVDQCAYSSNPSDRLEQELEFSFGARKALTTSDDWFFTFFAPDTSFAGPEWFNLLEDTN
jgi:hypothetical protein